MRSFKPSRKVCSTNQAVNTSNVTTSEKQPPWCQGFLMPLKRKKPWNYRNCDRRNGTVGIFQERGLEQVFEGAENCETLEIPPGFKWLRFRIWLFVLSCCIWSWCGQNFSLQQTNRCMLNPYQDYQGIFRKYRMHVLFFLRHKKPTTSWTFRHERHVLLMLDLPSRSHRSWGHLRGGRNLVDRAMAGGWKDCIQTLKQT